MPSTRKKAKGQTKKPSKKKKMSQKKRAAQVTAVVVPNPASFKAATPTASHPDHKSFFSQDLKIGQKLGSGTWGVVYEACHPKLGVCNVAIKHLFTKEDVTTLNYHSSPAYRDIGLYTYLKSKTLNGRPIVPDIKGWEIVPCKSFCKVHRNKACRAKSCQLFRIAMEKFDGNVDNLIDNITEEHSQSDYQVIPSDILTQMFQLAVRLGALGIVHGDLKLDQFLYRKTAEDAYDIRVIDFGFSGAIPAARRSIHNMMGKSSLPAQSVTDAYMGWMSEVKWPFGKLVHDSIVLTTAEQAILFNVWNLYCAFWSDPVLIYDEQNQTYHPFGGIKGLTHAILTRRIFERGTGPIGSLNSQTSTFAETFFTNAQKWTQVEDDIHERIPLAMQSQIWNLTLDTLIKSARH